jgi:hypothetical protein
MLRVEMRLSLASSLKLSGDTPDSCNDGAVRMPQVDRADREDAREPRSAIVRPQTPLAMGCMCGEAAKSLLGFLPWVNVTVMVPTQV